MQRATTAVAPDVGPRPSPARRWAPFVIVSCAVVAACNVAAAVLNLAGCSSSESTSS